jgi:hypothetical protein
MGFHDLLDIICIRYSITHQRFNYTHLVAVSLLATRCHLAYASNLKVEATCDNINSYSVHCLFIFIAFLLRDVNKECNSVPGREQVLC